MAGILDLKGKVIRKKNQTRATPQFVLIVETRHYPIVRELARMVGTAPELQVEKDIPSFARRGCTEHCPDQHVHVNEQLHMPAIARWTVTGLPMAIVLFNVLPFLRTDSLKGFTEAMNEAMSYAPTEGRGRGAIDKAIRRLMDLGWEIPATAYGLLENRRELTRG